MGLRNPQKPHAAPFCRFWGRVCGPFSSRSGPSIANHLGVLRTGTSASQPSPPLLWASGIAEPVVQFSGSTIEQALRALRQAEEECPIAEATVDPLTDGLREELDEVAGVALAGHG
jgi:hypothetical protein